MKCLPCLIRRIGRGIVICAALVSASVGAFDSAVPPQIAAGTLQPAFAPWDDIEGLIIENLAMAKNQVLVQAYLLSNQKIVAALIAAKQRGVDVRVLVDGRQLEQVGASKVAALTAADVPVWLETRYQNAHNKVIVIDPAATDATVITGSFNFTWSAQHKNAENILIARKNPALAARYALNWERHRLDAIPYTK